MSKQKMKETQESKVWSKNNGFCGAKVGGECNVGHVPSQISYNDVGKAAYRKENGLGDPLRPPSSTLIYYVKTANEQRSSNRLVLL
ncbi:hypothetical protein POTOM_021771 [Populus tomentosa]|uniref:Uncharacterized protein n=1 Tax=Populus tomentosa TaxID=118781 RepID=A0A8X7ZP17_POPTO|nr:hypothetical protein POTOM_021771 [Populus tomentosa]